MYKAIISIVPQNNGDVITTAARNAGAGGGTILLGKGTSESGVLHLLGLGDTTKEITINIVPEEITDNIFQTIIQATEDKKSQLGILFKLNVEDFLKAGSDKKNNENTLNQDLL